MAQLADTLTTRDAVRRAVLDDIVARAEMAATVIEGGPLDGISVVSIGTLRDQVTAALLVDLPPASEKYAEVITPATVAVSAVCPECREVTEIVVKLGPRLTVEGGTTELAVKAKSKPVVHMHGQLSLPAGEGQISVEEALGEIDDLRIRILRAVADVSDRWGAEEPEGPPPTLDAIAKALELVTESDIGDLEESLYAYSQAEEPLVEVVSVKGEPVQYVLTDAGIALLGDAEADAEADGDDASEPGGFSDDIGRAALDELNRDLDGEDD